MVKNITALKKAFKNCAGVHLDTNILIYLFQNNEKYSGLLEEIFNFLDAKKITIYFSTLLLTELLVDPFKRDQSDIAKNWLSYFKVAENLEIVDLSPSIAVDAAYLRAKYNIKTPDSIHLATAMQKQKTIFLTNDADLKKIKETKVVCIEDFS